MMKKLLYAITLILVGAPAFAAVDPNEAQIGTVETQIDNEQGQKASCGCNSKESCKSCTACKNGKPCKSCAVCKKGKPCKKTCKKRHERRGPKRPQKYEAQKEYQEEQKSACKSNSGKQTSRITITYHVY